jgi:hypothetical protein
MHLFLEQCGASPWWPLTRRASASQAHSIDKAKSWPSALEKGRGDVALLSDVTYQSLLVDNAAYQLVKNPTAMNGVMLLENMQATSHGSGGGIHRLARLSPRPASDPRKLCRASARFGPDIAGKNRQPYR